jgi:hypothetical protein
MTKRLWVANPASQQGCGGAEMGEQRGLAQGTSGDPSWATVAVTTWRLWRQRHLDGRRSTTWRHRGVLVLSAVAAVALGALVTLALTHQGSQQASKTTSSQPQPTNAAQNTPAALQIAAANRNQAAAWIAQQILPSVVIGCDPLMCQALEAANVSAGRLSEVQPSAPDPLGVEVIVATPALRSQFGPRLAAVYAPLVLASFGAGVQRIDIRYVAPGGTAAFEASLASAKRSRIEAGQQLLGNKHVQASAQARSVLLAGNVDPRLLITLGLLAHEMPLRLIVFNDPSPGASSAVPLRGAEIGASTSAGLSAMLAFLAQQTTYQPSQYHEARIASGQAITVQYDAPGPLGLNGP